MKRGGLARDSLGTDPADLQATSGAGLAGDPQAPVEATGEGAVDLAGRVSRGGVRCGTPALLAALVALLLSYPYLLDPRGEPSAALLVIITVVLLAAVIATARSRLAVAIGSALLLPAVTGNWLGLEDPASALGLVLWGAECGFYCLAIGLLLRHVFDARGAMAEKLFSALCAYLLAGLAFFTLYEMLEICWPGSLRAPDGAVTWSDLLYFSFVTLTTLGYGDITPVSVQAQSLTVVEAAFGVVYMAVMVAWLVGALASPAARADA